MKSTNPEEVANRIVDVFADNMSKERFADLEMTISQALRTQASQYEKRIKKLEASETLEVLNLKKVILFPADVKNIQ